MLGIKEQLHAEPAADIARDDADAVFRNIEDARSEQVADEMGALRRTPQRVGIFSRVVIADRAARLHRVDDDAVVDELQADSVPGRGHRTLDRRAVADLPVKAQITRCLVPYPGSARIEGVSGLDDGRQRLVVDAD